MSDVHVTILVENGFVPTELALVQDILRIASRLSSDIRFTSKICTSSDQDLIEGHGGMVVRAVPFACDSDQHPHHILVLGGTGIGPAFGGLRARLRFFERLGCHLILLSEAASEWLRLFPDTADITTHWENQQLLRDSCVTSDRDLPLYSQTKRITTAAGMLATADVVLNTIVAPLCAHLAQATGQVLLIDKIRDGRSLQPRSENDNISLRLANVESVISILEAHLDTPLSMSELANMSGMSIRQLERNFKKALGCGPAAFYRSLRLRRGKSMVEQTTLPLAEIAVSSGFSSSSSFSKMFAREFGTTPKQCRKRIAADASQKRLRSDTSAGATAYPTTSANNVAKGTAGLIGLPHNCVLKDQPDVSFNTKQTDPPMGYDVAVDHTHGWVTL